MVVVVGGVAATYDKSRTETEASTGARTGADQGVRGGIVRVGERVSRVRGVRGRVGCVRVCVIGGGQTLQPVRYHKTLTHHTYPDQPHTYNSHFYNQPL